MGNKNFRGYLQGDEVRFKKYLYALRPLLAVRWIDSEKGMPPMRFADLVAGTVTDVALLAEINELLAIKMSVGEAELGPRRPAIHGFIETMLREAEIGVVQKRPEGDVALFDAFLQRVVLR